LRFSELDEVFTPPIRASERFRSAFAEAAFELAQPGPLRAVERVAA
jgi:hypothetical protein